MPTPASVSESLSVAVASVVSGLGLQTRTVPPASPAVVRRKRPEVPDGLTPPLIVVCVGDEEVPEVLGTGSDGKLLWAVKRPVTVAIAFKSAGEGGDNLTVRSWREKIWPAVNERSLKGAGLTQVNRVDPRGNAIFDAAALQTVALDWSVLTFDTETVESY